MAPLLLAGLAAVEPPATAPEPSASRPASAPAVQRVAVPLPVSWHGHYKGNISFLRAGKPGREVMMELAVDPIPGSASVSWKIAVEDSGKRRELAYELLPVPGYPGHFLLDDKNSGLTDQALVGNALISQFNVPGSVVYSRFERTADGVEIEISNSQAAPFRASGLPGAPVQSYPLVYIQRGLLRPMEK